MISRFFLTISLFFAAIVLHAAEPTSTAPRLAVVISVDQLRADYLIRFRPFFGEGGFKRLLEGGLDFQNNHYRHANTQTAPGHATILSGAFPNVHGIISNDWLDRDLWEVINNVEDRTSPLVGLSPADASAALLAPKAGRSPRNFQASTVGDQLKLRYGDRSKVFAASNKDRSAILLGGKLADSAYWDEAGVMVTSRYYREQVPAWVKAFNAERLVHATFGKTWERVREPAIYDAVQGPDDAPGEMAELGLARTFPKRITGGREEISPAFFSAFDNSPFSAEFLGEFVQRAIREEKLGHSPATDLLCVSFSQIDSMGHNYGPDSHEMMDSMIRLDRVLAALLDTIDREVGLARCVVVLTADHGVSPMPDRALAMRPDLPAGRVKLSDLDAAGRKVLDGAFGPLEAPMYWFTRDNMGFHFRPDALAAKKLTVEEVGQVLKASVVKFPYIAMAYTRNEVLAASGEGESLLAMAHRGFHPSRDRDVGFVLKPYYYPARTNNVGTTHGSPYAYDTHVPQLWFGAGVPHGVRIDRVGVEDIAPTLAALLGLSAPPEAQGRRLF